MARSISAIGHPGCDDDSQYPDDEPRQPEYTDCPNCGTTDHTWLPCPCACHEEPF